MGILESHSVTNQLMAGLVTRTDDPSCKGSSQSKLLLPLEVPLPRSGSMEKSANAQQSNFQRRLFITPKLSRSPLVRLFVCLFVFSREKEPNETHATDRIA